MKARAFASMSIVLFLAPATAAQEPEMHGPPWKRYAIDSSLRGADGVKLADANGDGRPDLVTGWEESGQVRAYFHPGKERVAEPWPRVNVGAAPATEDAVWVDLNGDGRLDVLSSCEGREQSLRMHLSPADDTRLLDPDAWKTATIESSQGVTRWMFAVPLVASNLPGEEPNSRVPEIVVGSKSPNGMVGMLRAESADKLSWTIEKLVDAEWIMSLVVWDVDEDGDADVLYTDRKGSLSGVYWLENPRLKKKQHEPGFQAASNTKRSAGEPQSGTWKRHLVGARGLEVMFIAFEHRSADWSDSYFRNVAGAERFYVGVKPNLIYRFSKIPSPAGDLDWQSELIEVEPTDRIGRTKGLAAGDLDGDGRIELVFSCESAFAPKSGLVYLKQDHSGDWKMHDVSGPEGIKYDLIELVDLDGDGDLDILTCEEREAGRGLGVIWYANPMK